MNSEVNSSHSGIFRNRRMLRTSDGLFSKVQFTLDVVAIELALYICLYLKDVQDFDFYQYPAFITPVLMWLIYSSSGVYQQHASKLNHIMAVTFAWTKVVALLIVMAFMLKVSEIFSRQVIITWFVIAVPFQLLMHLAFNKFRMEQVKRDPIPSLLVGDGEMGRYLARHINSDPWSAYKIIGLIKDGYIESKIKDLEILGGISELRFVVLTYGIRRVYFALPMKTSHQLRDLQLELLDLNVDIVWAPDIFGLHMLSPSVKEVAGVPLFHLSESPMVEGAGVSKFILDKVLSVIALLLLSPVLLAAILAVKISSPGPVFFRQERHGLDGKIFHVLKFRSMQLHEEEEGRVSQAKRGDSRVTKVGAFLRRTSIDELPQLINVLKGDMSLVGPRPHAKAHNHYYADKIDAYMSRHRILPGMTGLAQVNGCRGETDTLEKMGKRVEFDLAYINNWSIWLDIRILIKTVYTLFSKNAY